jgi:hypothetical protein
LYLVAPGRALLGLCARRAQVLRSGFAGTGMIGLPLFELTFTLRAKLLLGIGQPRLWFGATAALTIRLLAFDRLISWQHPFCLFVAMLWFSIKEMSLAELQYSQRSAGSNSRSIGAAGALNSFGAVQLYLFVVQAQNQKSRRPLPNEKGMVIFSGELKDERSRY